MHRGGSGVPRHWTPNISRDIWAAALPHCHLFRPNYLICHLKVGLTKYRFTVTQPPNKLLCTVHQYGQRTGQPQATIASAAAEDDAACCPQHAAHFSAFLRTQVDPAAVLATCSGTPQTSLASLFIARHLSIVVYSVWFPKVAAVSSQAFHTERFSEQDIA